MKNRYGDTATRRRREGAGLAPLSLLDLKIENRKSKIENGLTLVELLMAMSIAAVVTAAVVGIFTTINARWGYEASHATAMRQAQLAMDRMAREIHSAMTYDPGPDAYGRTYIFTLPANTD